MKRSMKTTGGWGINVVALVCVTMLLLATGQSCAQDPDRRSGPTEVKVEMLSAEIVKFDTTIVIGLGKRAIAYDEALVLKMTASRAQLDSLPPSIAPLLYLGQQEYHIFRVSKGRSNDERILTFHVLNWEALDDSVRVVLTIDHGRPIREARKYRQRRDLPLLMKSSIIDRR